MVIRIRTLFQVFPFLKYCTWKIVFSSNFKVLDISSLSLKKLTVYTNYHFKLSKIRVASSNLVSLDLTCPFPLDFCFEGLNSLQTMIVKISIYLEVNFVEAGQVMCRMLQGVCCTCVLMLTQSSAEEALFLALAEPRCSFLFCNLKFLTVELGSYWNRESLFNLLNSSPNLEMLRVFFNFGEDLRPLKIPDTSIPCMTNNLKMVELYKVHGFQELEGARFLLKNGYALRKVKVGWWKWFNTSMLTS